VSASAIVVLLRRLRVRPDAGVAAGQGAPPALIGRCDAAALRAALQLRKPLGASAAIALAVGGAHSEDEVLRLALAAGADRAARVDDPSLGQLDYHGLARLLAAAVRREGAKLVLAGDRSEDEGQGAVGPAVAEALDVPHVTAARDLRADGAHVSFTRRDAGVVRTFKLALPALVTVAAQAGPEVRSPPGAARPSGDGALIVHDLAALGLQEGELKHREALLGRAQAVRLARNATMVGDVADLVARLRDDRLLG
jgi:electron transfer flavoprotein beta subunit